MHWKLSASQAKRYVSGTTPRWLTRIPHHRLSVMASPILRTSRSRSGSGIVSLTATRHRSFPRLIPTWSKSTIARAHTLADAHGAGPKFVYEKGHNTFPTRSDSIGPSASPSGRRLAHTSSEAIVTGKEVFFCLLTRFRSASYSFPGVGATLL